MKKSQKLNPVDGKHVVLTDGFWSERLSVFEKVTIPDVFDKFERDRGGAFNNFKRVRDKKTGYHAGPPWYDGLIGECIRGASDFLGRNYDKALDERLDGYIKLIAEAQDASGDDYLNTYTTLICPEHRWGRDGGELLWQHDLYNTGCLVEAGVHHYLATGKTTMLTVAVKLANHVTNVMGPKVNVNIVPAHSLPEEAYLNLYNLFVEQPELKNKLNVPVNEGDYLNLVKYWLDMRGNHQERQSYPRYMGEYSVDHMPLTSQSEAVGHSVRAALLYSGMAEYINITGDKDYEAATRRLWENIIGRKMHISGGIGAVHSEEKFGYEYQLPNTAYLETCASVALLFFARNMFLRNGESEYVDVIERALYNGILPGISLSGNEYFYRNPLMSDGSEKRWGWHDCPCCPPMFLKVMGELPSYLYALDDDGIYVNLYAASSVKLNIGNEILELAQETNFPWSGEVKLTVKSCPRDSFKIRLRIPEYCDSYTISLNKNEISAKLENGYVEISGSFKAGDEIALNLTLKPVAMKAHPYVKDDNGKVALQYGPLLYCVESVDNDLENLVVPEKPAFQLRPSEAFAGVTDIIFEDTLYRVVRAVPYYVWANREIGKMNVWLAMENFKNTPADSWGNKLYMPYEY